MVLPVPAVEKPKVVSLDKVRYRLGMVWLIGCLIIVLVMIIGSYSGHFRGPQGNKIVDRSAEAWTWLIPTIVPTLGMILSGLGFSALTPGFSTATVRKSFFSIAVVFSVFYLGLVSLTILIQPLLVSADPITLMRESNLWLGPLQGLVASVLGVLFVSTDAKKPA